MLITIKAIKQNNSKMSEKSQQFQKQLFTVVIQKLSYKNYGNFSNSEKAY